MGRRWPFSLKGQLEMTDDPIDDLMIFDESDDSHLAAALRTEEEICPSGAVPPSVTKQ